VCLSRAPEGTVKGKLTVLFEERFWIGVAERDDEAEGYAIARVVFGEEPTGAQLLDWALNEYRDLQFAPVAVAPGRPRPREPRRNPKRAQREVARAAAERGLETRAQAAVREVIESRKEACAASAKRTREEEEARRWALRVERRKQKHRGR
jgi:hypothetical protein